MTGHAMFTLSPGWRNRAFVCVGIGIASTTLGFVLYPVNTWITLLVDSYYFLTVALFGVVILAIQSVSGAAWITPVRRVPEAFTTYLLPGGALLLAVTGIGGHTLYEWTHHSHVARDEILRAKATYLNEPFFFIRLVVIVALWWWFARALTRLSHEQDRTGDIGNTKRAIRYSVSFLILFTLSFSLANVDWIMSIEPHWFSTVFGVYCFSGLFVGGVSAMSFGVLSLQAMGYLKTEVNRNHYHDLGKLMFGFATFWAYIWFSQYMLIWYTNIPEETAYYMLRLQNDWDWLFWFNLVLNWAVPFIILLPRASKRSPAVLLRVSIALLVGRWFDIYLLVAPKVFEVSGMAKPFITFTDVGIGFGFLGIFILMTAKAISKKSLIPSRDPYIIEGMALTQ